MPRDTIEINSSGVGEGRYTELRCFLQFKSKRNRNSLIFLSNIKADDNYLRITSVLEYFAVFTLLRESFLPFCVVNNVLRYFTVSLLLFVPF